MNVWLRFALVALFLPISAFMLVGGAMDATVGTLIRNWEHASGADMWIRASLDAVVAGIGAAIFFPLLYVIGPIREELELSIERGQVTRDTTQPEGPYDRVDDQS
jgi:hypothetical protein